MLSGTLSICRRPYSGSQVSVYWDVNWEIQNRQMLDDMKVQLKSSTQNYIKTDKKIKSVYFNFRVRSCYNISPEEKEQQKTDWKIKFIIIYHLCRDFLICC